ncbi:MAG: hypothetical protein P1U57_13715 [Oleibacter sp.]|nr:hypothetical protein [Thalassolituus sp.]
MTLSPIARASWCFAVARSCMPHVHLQAAQQQWDLTALLKCLSKLEAFLSGELQSQDNLMRFYGDFVQWRDSLTAEDQFNARVCELSFSALCASLDTLSDDECDDIDMIKAVVNQLYEELTEIGGPTPELRSYWEELNEEWLESLEDVSQRPLPKASLRVLTNVDVSPFGLVED